MGLGIRTIYLLTFILLATLSFPGGLQFVYGVPPTVMTLYPTNVTATSATLRGTVNPRGKSTIIDFASLLPNGNPGYFPPAPSPPQNIGSGNVSVPVSYTLTSLHPSTEYRYYVKASNADGGNHGAVVVFNTPSAGCVDRLGRGVGGDSAIFTQCRRCRYAVDESDGFVNERGVPTEHCCSVHH